MAGRIRFACIDLSRWKRRLVAVMVAEPLNYPAQDDVRAQYLLEKQGELLRPVFASHRGHEMRAPVGGKDGIGIKEWLAGAKSHVHISRSAEWLVEFADGFAAASCAIEVQKTVQNYNRKAPADLDIHLRIGLHLGDIEEQNEGVFGEGVAFASRIAKLAHGGETYISGQLYDQIKTKDIFLMTKLEPTGFDDELSEFGVYSLKPSMSRANPQHEISYDSKRLAVLPFVSLSPDPNDEYFADGVTEEIISTVSRVSGLTVISRTSVMGYKGTTKKVREIGRELEVGSILEGSFRKAGNRIRIATQLIDVPNDHHLWAQNYDKQLDDIFEIQSDVAKQVADALQIRLLSADQKKLEKVPTSNIKAYTLYLKGQHDFHGAGGASESLRKAVGYFEQAVSNDPDFALAYAQLAYCYNQLGFYGMLPSREAGKIAKTYIEKALAMDDSLAEAHQIMGRILRNFDWDFALAEKEFRRAIELSPSLAEAHGGRALLLAYNRRFDEAIAEVKQALSFDPISSSGLSYAGIVYLYGGRYDDAIEQFSKNLEVDPSHIHARLNLGLAHIQKEMFEIGIREITGAASVRDPSSQCDLAYAYAKAGKLDELRKLLEKLLDEASRNPEQAVAVASAYANLGEVDKAIEWLERAYVEHISYLIFSNCDLAFDCIRQDTRFQGLMKKVGWTNTR